MPLIRRDPAAAAAAAERPDDLRHAEARALARSRDAEGLAAALRQETDPGAREILLAGLVDIGDPAPLAGFLGSADAGLRVAACGALRLLGPAALPLLPGLLADPDPDIRLLATEIALGLPAEAATAALLPVLLGDAEPNVCSAAVEVLSEVGTPAAVPALAALPRRFPGNAFLQFACDSAMARIEGHAQGASAATPAP